MTTVADYRQAKAMDMDEEDFCWMFQSMLLQEGWKVKPWSPANETGIAADDQSMDMESAESDDSRSSDASSPLASSPTISHGANPSTFSDTNHPNLMAPTPEHVHTSPPLPASSSLQEPTSPPRPPIPGCAALQSLLHFALSSDADSSSSALQTTGGTYLDIILAHRDAFAAFPNGHASCAVAFSDLARALEMRAWSECGPAGDADHEAVVVFRQEAWLIANYFTNLSSPTGQMGGCRVDLY